MNAPASTDLADRLIAATGRIRRSLRRADARATDRDESDNLTLSQEAVIGHLTRGGAMSTADLARIEGVRPQSMRLTVGALDDLGLVAKADDPSDARKSLVDLTDAGRASREASRGLRARILASRFDERLDASDLACIARALDLVDRVVD